jgi:hypothetical protein
MEIGSLRAETREKPNCAAEIMFFTKDMSEKMGSALAVE